MLSRGDPIPHTTLSQQDDQALNRRHPMLDDIKKTLWATADKLRANMDAAAKHLVLGLIFVKYISDTFAARRTELRPHAVARRQAGRTCGRGVHHRLGRLRA